MASSTDFVELHCRSAFTFLDGASLPEDLVAAAADIGHDTLALADRDGLYGAPRFYKAAQAAGLRAIVGSAVMIREDSPRRHRDAERKDNTVELRYQDSSVTQCLRGESSSSLLLLVENREGYKNLCKLLTRGKLTHPKGEASVTLDDLEEFSRGLFAIVSRPPSFSSSQCPRGENSSAFFLDRLVGILGRDHTAIEVQRHFAEDDAIQNSMAVELGEHHRVPIVATNDVRYAREQNARLYDVLTCIRDGTTLDAAGRRLLLNRERHLKSSAEMAALFHDLPRAIAATREMADRLAFTLADLGYRFPDFPLPTGETQQGHLERLTWEHARTRFRPLHDAARRQLARELALIGKLGLAGYFLIVWDIVRFCRDSGILVQGRGSAANSAVCYALGITAVDPIKMGLLFERFLSEERGEWPDIDLDLPSGDQRERVIQHVYARYGKHGAAMTANVITYRGRSAVRDVGKVLGLPADAIARLSKFIGRHGFEDEDKIHHRDTEAQRVVSGKLSSVTQRLRGESFSLFFDLCRELQNLPRHLGQHSGGMVIAAGRLDEVVPLEPASMPGRVVVQWDKDDCSDLKIIKVDLLGLGMLAALEEAVPLIRAHDGVDIDLAHLPPDDPAVYDMCSRADTVGVFQIESRAQMATLPRMRPRCFYDLVVEVGLIRPGPIVGKMVHPYLRRRAGREKVTYPHPALKPVLERTLGVPLFQEQLMRVAMVVAGFSGGQAEELRRAMGFKRSAERMRAIERDLRAGMARNGISGAAADDIVRGITSFAEYGFPESHAASFALIAYASAYLKAHHPAAFTAALLNCYPMGFYHPSTLVKDAERHGVRVLPIDVNHAKWKCTLEGSSSSSLLRIGLRYVAGLCAERARAIEAAAPFCSLADFTRRVSLHTDEVTSLASIGAFASLGETRRSALWQLAELARRGDGLFAVEEKSFGGSSSPLPEMSPIEETAADYVGTGLTTGPHPMAHLRESLTRQGIVRATDLTRVPNGRITRAAGLVICRQRPGTAKGVLFLSLEDETGIANAIVTQSSYEAHRELLVTASALIIEGALQKQEGVIHIRATRFAPLGDINIKPESHDFR
jgi:error-prone DNA polymerase